MGQFTLVGIWKIKIEELLVPAFEKIRIKEPPVLGVWKKIRLRIISSGYFNTLKESLGFRKELMVFWEVIWLFFSKISRTTVICEELGILIFVW
jgi:hypothetical protein